MLNSKLNSISQRETWIDVLKFIAIFMMIAGHCGDNVAPAERFEPWYNLWGSLYGSLMRPVIPIFVMITGVLLLPVQQEIGIFYRKRLPRLLIPFLIWSIGYNLFPWITGLLGLNPSIINDFFPWASTSQNLSDSLYNIAMIPFAFSAFTTQMWYVYLLIGIYFYLPIFSVWVKNSTKKEQHIFLGLWFISMFIPYLREYLTNNLWGVCSWNEFGMLYSFAGFNGYLFLGYYLKNNPITWSWTKLAWIGIPLFLIGYCTTFFGFKSITSTPGQADSLVELFYTYCSPNVLLITLPIFVAVQKLNITSPRIKAIFANASACTFGMWMSHYIFVGPCYELVDSFPIHTMFKMILCSIIVLSITWTFVAVVLKWKKFGKWIMG